MHSFLFSVIVPIYNVERHLASCLDSIVNQDIGFVDNIELILVNDGSTDCSGDICLQYMTLYPNNVHYVKQKNLGPAPARNRGLEAARGIYVSFIDADDYISTDAFRAVKNYFASGPKTANVAIIETKYFGTKSTARKISMKFDQGTRTVNLNSPMWHYVCPRVAPSFIKTHIANQYRFSSDTKYFEDTRFINEIILNDMLLGVVAEGTYYYRRYDGSNPTESITAAATEDARFYLDAPKHVLLHLFDKASKNKQDFQSISNTYGTQLKQVSQIPLYFQYLALYEFRWRTFYNLHTPKDILSAEQFKEYQDCVTSILSKISNEAIIGFDLYRSWQKLYLLNLKHKMNILDEATLDSHMHLRWDGHILFDATKELHVRLMDLRVNRNMATFEGFFAVPPHASLTTDAKVHRVRSSKFYHTNETIGVSDFALDHPFYSYRKFILDIPLAVKPNRISFLCTANNETKLILKIRISQKESPCLLSSPLIITRDAIIRRFSSRIIITKATWYNAARFRIGIRIRETVHKVLKHFNIIRFP